MNDIAMDMAVDRSGNVIVVGRSEISSDPSIGKFYAVKISSSGETLWTKSWNVSSSDVLTGVAVDPEDNILMVGSCNLTTDHIYGFIYKFDPDGTELWSVEIEDLNYAWYHILQSRYVLDVQLLPASDDFIVVGSVHDTAYNMFISRYTAAGSLVWNTQWFGPSDYFGCIANAMWLSVRNLTIVSCLLSNEETNPDFETPCVVAFNFHGQPVWNYTLGEISGGFEMDSDEFIYATYAGRSLDHVVSLSYNFTENWNLDMIVDDTHNVDITGFLANDTLNLIGYGEVRSLIAGQSVTKSYIPAFSGFQPPQTLIFSFTPDGELLWFDFLVIGRISDPCGLMFDPEGRLIVAGHTSPFDFDSCDFYIVFDFHNTPFPLLPDSLAIVIFPVINVVALCSIWIVGKVRHEQLSESRLTLANTAKVLIISEFILHSVLYISLIGFTGGGGPPPPLVYYPPWVTYLLAGLTYSLAIPVILYLILWLREYKS
ncbi:MAG: hypothetical protein ACFFEV_02645 [Candidatus Thorarchaeota archaeon]